MTATQTTSTDQEILCYLLSKVPVSLFNSAINNYSLQTIYERFRISLIHKFFNGDRLRYGIEMRRIFNQFQTVRDEMKAQHLKVEMNEVLVQYKRLSKFNPSKSALLGRYNELVTEHNELCKGVEVLRNLYMKSRKLK